MRLKTKLVAAATGMTFAIVLVLSALFVGELLRQRVEQTAANNDALAHQVYLMTRQAVETGLRAHPPVDRSDDALHASVTDALRSYEPLANVMKGILRYYQTVQDVSVTDAHGVTLVSTDPDAVNQPAVYRANFASVKDGSVVRQTLEVFGKPRVLDVTVPLDRNGQPFLVVHVGVRSTFLRASYAPWLRAAFLFAVLAGLASMAAAGLLATLALRPIEDISRQLEDLALAEGSVAALPAESAGLTSDAFVKVTKTIDRLGQQIRSKDAGYTALQANLNQMLDTLRDGVLLFTGDRRAVMVSDAVAFFVNQPEGEMVGKRLEEIFDPETALGAAVLEAFEGGLQLSAEGVTLEDGRQVQISIDQIEDASGGGGQLGTLVTLRDTESAMQLGQELEISRRLAAIGRLTAGVGHEVKNPINAMVVHLELLRAKLAEGNVEGQTGALKGAQRHVDILAGEMQRLDRVVQTLADFSRPMELHLREHDMRKVVQAVVELTGAEMEEQRVTVTIDAPREPVMVRVDAELVRQALLNLLLNGMQAMPDGGKLKLRVRRESHFAVVEVEDVGEGIPPELLPRIFDLYFTTKPKGSGIGLAMTYRILQMHGGAMDVRSNADATSPERGTTFTLRLPVAMSATAEARRPQAAVAGRREIEERL